MAPLHQPNIVSTLNWEQLDGRDWCIVMEWIEMNQVLQQTQNDSRRLADTMKQNRDICIGHMYPRLMLPIVEVLRC